MIKQISVFVENKPKRLAEITGVLMEADINLCAASIADTSDFGIFRIIVNKPEEAETALKEAGMIFKTAEVLGLKLPDHPGAFAEAVKILSNAGINIEYMYAFNTGNNKKAQIIIRVNDNVKALDVLEKNNIQLIEEEDIYQNPNNVHEL